MIALEMPVRGARPISATQTDQRVAYDALFAAARDRLVRICVGLTGLTAVNARTIIHRARRRLAADLREEEEQ